ncbi:MAG: hypothetical protein KC729_12190, partial [Candidatus Eisenbacteria bacterium]|nr:hypothetical protein [Candidatus Eisenbacteria bacterium]
HEQQKKIDPNQNPGLGMTLHGYGSAWMRYGAVVDSIETVRYGLFFLAAADTVVEFRDVRDPYSAFLRDYSRGYLIKAEFSRSLSDTDSALAYARRVLPWCDARVYPQSHAATQRVIAETRLLRATLVPDRAQAREELAAARQALDPAWTCVDSTQTRELLRLAILEARWNRIHAEVGLPRAAGDEDWLDRADERLQEAEGYLKSIDFPVPRAGLRLEEARVAVARARLDHSDESRGAADSLIRDCETIVPEADWPRYHHEIADLAAELARIGG